MSKDRETDRTGTPSYGPNEGKSLFKIMKPVLIFTVFAVIFGILAHFFK
jgi:hypothetical protein